MFKSLSLALLTALVVQGFATKAYAPNRRPHDHIGNFNFMDGPKKDIGDAPAPKEGAGSDPAPKEIQAPEKG